jgi:hypothetical protein
MAIKYDGGILLGADGRSANVSDPHMNRLNQNILPIEHVRW